MNLDIQPAFVQAGQLRGVSSIDPLMVPLVALEIVRSPMAGPRTPAATALCRLAVVAAESNPSKEPVISSFVPLSTAETEPEPARAGARPGVGRQRREAGLECFTALRGKQESERAEPDPYHRNRNSPIECHFGLLFYIQAFVSRRPLVGERQDRI